MEQQLRSWLRVCIFFGIYMNTTNTNSAKFITVTHSKPTRNLIYYLQRCYIFLLYCGICTLYLRGIALRDYPPGLLHTWITAGILFTTRVLANSLIFIEAVWKEREHGAFLNLLRELERSLRLRLSCDVRRMLLLKYTRRVVCYQVALSVFCTAPFMISTIWLNYRGFFWDGFWSICTMRLRSLQLLVYMRILHHYMSCLCEKLQQVVAFRMAPTRELLAMDVGKLGTLEYLLAIQEIYMRIYEAFQLLNTFAGWSLCGIVISSMFDLGATFYWLLQSSDDADDRSSLLTDIWWFIPVTAFMWYLCYFCDKCKQLAQTISHLLQKIIISRSLSSLVQYRLVLYQFSTQLHLQRIEVSAGRFFVLNLRFIMSACTAISMLMVILSQF